MSLISEQARQMKRLNTHVTDLRVAQVCQADLTRQTASNLEKSGNRAENEAKRNENVNKNENPWRIEWSSLIGMAKA